MSLYDGPMASDVGDRLHVDVLTQDDFHEALARDVKRGLSRQPKTLPPKYFYDERGAKLFDAICDTPEYYPTRVEQALLERIAPGLIRELAPTAIVELGSGAARKTRTVLDAVASAGLECCYVPFDVSEEMLRASAARLLRDYPWLGVHGVVGDYDRDLEHLPTGERRLFLFLGGTIGNFDVGEDKAFLSRVATQMTKSDFLLLGTDLVKDERTLNAAYNDAQGITAEFNLNVLSVINRELGGRFNPDHFEHVAFFDREKSRIEMHLRSSREQQVSIEALGLRVGFEAGETILTEISRKFTRASAERLLASSGLALARWDVPDDEAFALSLSQRA